MNIYWIPNISRPYTRIISYISSFNFHNTIIKEVFNFKVLVLELKIKMLSDLLQDHTNKQQI